MAFDRPVIEATVIRLGIHQDWGKRYGVLNASIHSLAAGGTVNVGRIAAKQDAPLAQALRNPVVNVEARTPCNVV